MLTSSKTSDAFLALICLGIGHDPKTLPDTIDWLGVKALAMQHGLSAILLDGVEKLPAEKRPPKMLTLQWIGEVMQNYEKRYEVYQKTIGELAEFYNKHGFKMMVIKGYGLSLNYPKPSHRPCGDIDIWQFGQYEEADKAISKAFVVNIDKDHHHHTVFSYKGFSVENHYDFLNVHYGHQNGAFEVVLKELAKDDTVTVEIDGQRVYLPSANLHALFMLRHAMANFASTDMNLRQVLDWAFFVEKQGDKIDWEFVHSVFTKFKMMKFLNCINTICIEDLGFPAGIFPGVQDDAVTKERVLADIISPEFNGKTPRSFMKRVVFKCRRWQANAWKQNLCYGDNRVKAFLVGVWSHLMKPSMI